MAQQASVGIVVVGGHVEPVGLDSSTFPFDGLARNGPESFEWSKVLGLLAFFLSGVNHLARAANELRPLTLIKMS